MPRHPTRYARWFAVALGITLSLGLLLHPAPVRAAAASVTPLRSPAGSLVTLYGIGFEHGETIVSWASSTRGSVYPTAQGEANSAGTVTIELRLGRFWEPGWWALTLHGRSSGREAVATFEVLATAPDGRLDVAPESAVAGSRIQFHGAGFRPGELVTAWATTPAMQAIAVESGITQDHDEIFFAFDVPASGPAGTWSMTAYGTQSQRLLIVPFTVTR